MKLKILSLYFFLLIGFNSFGQALLRDSTLSIVSFQFGYGAGFPAGDLSEKSTYIHNFSPSISFKTTKNWIWQFEYNILMGHDNLQNSFVDGVYSEISVPISTEGLLEEVKPRFQGMNVQLKVGKILHMTSHNKNTGFVGMLGVGLIQHRIKYVYKGELVPQLEGEYVKGYDRLTNGLSLSQEIGYRKYGNGNKFNYQIAFEINQGFTQNRRSWNFDEMKKDDTKRLDIYYGLKFIFILPAYGVSN